MRSQRMQWVVVALLGLLVVASVVALLWPGAGTAPGGRGTGQIAVVTIDGPIAGGGSAEGLLGAVVGADEVVAQLQKARDDPAVRAVVIRMNTPGGSAAAAQEIGVAVQRLRDAGKPVVASIADLGASGGYWIAAMADRIVANPASLTGSIGVIMEVTHYEDLYQKLGIDVETIKSGPYKDIGSATRPLTEEERRLLQGLVNDIYQQFVDVVARGRKLSRERVLELADGRVFTGRQAKEAGLVDELGTFEDAADLAAELAGLEDYELVDYSSPGSLLDLLRWFGTSGRLGLAQGAGLVPQLVRWELFRAVPR
ncbi:signal peptide peptidase A [Thermaerobacter marianensis DSM 12885]|uniref:Signal peptide peptidase A n=1 Tax=Thermaerobacter marianensis (strain ATCC 700841 / DSM 12885 / JCM 10246 / 7p75a) TaxID=644966 RepID=E6SLH2_THEM7|nr:signal peptide peptidase SppA [Thermaerobacter marianensis]ADU52414.1 signal peptide peptidase A [Thermaerobacter marianensis DSM 12885]